MITIFDTETTGLLMAKGSDINLQPYIIEICAIQVDESDNIINEIETLVFPPMNIPLHITKITGITTNDVSSAPIFSEIYKDLLSVFFGSHTVVAHNLSFDVGMLVNELTRINKEFSFPYPPIQFCTVEQSMHIKGYRLKNSELYTLATGKEIEGSHRAKADVLATYESYKWLKSKKSN